MKRNLTHAELPARLAAAEQRIADLERDIAQHKKDLSECEQEKEKLRSLENNEQRFRALIENGLDDITLLDAQGTQLWESPVVVRNLGYAPNAYVGHNIFELMHPEDRTWTSELFAQLVHEPGSRQSGIFRLRHASGSWRWVEAIVSNMLEEPTVKAVVVNYRDITERKQAEAARNEAELRYRALFEQSHDAIFILDFAGRHSAVNQRAVDLLGYSREELLNLSAHEISAEPTQSQEFLQRLISGEQIPLYERLLRKKDGSVIPVEINVELVHDLHGKPLHIQSFVRDITDRRKAEIELQHRNDDLGLINAINEVIVQGGNLETVVHVLAKEMKRIFASEGSTIYILDPDERSLTMQQYLLPLEVSRRIEKLIGGTIPIIKIPIREGGHFQKVLDSGRGIITSDPKEIQSWMAEFAETTFLPSMARRAIRKLIPQIYRLLNIKSTVIVPLISNGKTIGLLDVSSSGWFSADDLTRVENIGRQLTAAILRQQAIEKIERSEAFLNSTQNALSASIAILDETGTIVRVNSAWRKFGEQNGLKHAEAGVGLNYLTICDSASGPNAEEASTVARTIREVIAGQKREAWVEYPAHGPDEKRWFLLRITKFEDRDKLWVVLAHENITERRQAQDAMQRSEAILAQAGKMAHLGAWEIEVRNTENLSDNIVHWSDEVYRIFGYELGRAEMTNGVFFEHVHPDDRQRVESAMSRAIAEKKSYEAEHRIIRTDGIERILEERASFIFDEQGQLLQILGAVQDITERKKIEKDLKESSEQFRTLFEASPEAIMLVDPQGDWPILDCNPAAYTMNGYTRGEVVGKSVDLFNLTPGDAAGRAEYLERVRKAGILRYDDLHRRKDGSVFPIEVSTSLVTLGGREVILGIDRDITERKRAEEVLRESEALYRQAIEVAGAVPYLQSYSGIGQSIKYEFIGEGIRQITGYGPEEFSAQLWDTLDEEIKLVDELEGYSLEEGIERVRSGKNSIWKCEHRLRDRDGNIHWVFEAAVELRDEHGVSHGSIGTYQDITTRKQMEANLQASETRYRLATLATKDVIWEWNQNTNQLIWTENAQSAFGYSPEEVGPEETWWDEHLHPEDRPRVLSKLNTAMTGNDSVWLEEYRFLLKDGSYAYVSDHGYIDRDVSGKAIRLIGAMSNITERKQAEAELRASEERFRQMANNIQEAFWMTDAITGEEIYASPAAERIWGQPLDSLMHDENLFLESVLPDDRGNVLQNLEAQRRGQKTTMEYRITRPDGSVRWIWDRAFPIFDDSGKAVRLAGIAADITGRKQAEEALYKSELKYRNLVETSHDLIWAIDADGLFTYLNQASKQIYGYEPEELIGRSFFEIMDPKSYHLDLDAFKKSIADQDKFVDYEVVVRHRDGRQIILSANSLVLRDENKNVTGVVGTSRDITDRKQVEEQLRKLSRAVEQSASTIVITNTLGQIEYVNPKFTETTGYTAEEVMGKNPRILKSGHTPPEEYGRLWKTITAGEEWHGELLNRKKNGELYWESATISPIFNELKETTHFIAVKEDITERKKNETEVNRHLAELEAVYVNGLAVGRLLEQQAIGERIIQTFAQYLSWHHVTIRLCKEKSDELELIAFHLPHLEDGITANEAQRMKSHVSRVGQGLSGWVVETGNPVRTSHLTDDPHYVQTYEDMQSGLYMPLKIGDRVIGVISVESEKTDAFSEQDERLLATLANQAATAFETARLYQSAQQEIWERRIAEDALRQSEENYRRLAQELEERVYERTAEVQDLYDNAPCGYHSLDQSGNVIRINQTELNWLGYTREEVLGHPLHDFVTDGSRKTFKETFPAFKQHGLLKDMELEMLRKDGSAFPALVSATAIYDKDGRYLTSRSTLFDDTDRKHAMETLRLANSEMKRAMRMKDEFLANMSHELRTPLNAILGLSESLLEQTPGPVNEKQLKYLGTINESGRHLLELINDILDLAKIESGQIKLDPGRVNINTVCETSLRMIKQLAQKKNQTVEVEIEKDIGHVWADERRLKQMMVNLLSNAVKFTPEEGKLGLKVGVNYREAQLLITIWDHGIGIREQDLKRLFQPFVQLDSSLSRESSGTGLGLALVAEMARLHGGSVSVSSQPGQGSQFTIILPWDPAITSDTLDKLKITGKIPIFKNNVDDKQTILLVEDTDSVVLMLRDYLELSGYKVEIARDGLEGVSKAIALRPDLILMDVQMPGLDGLEATRRIRKESGLKNTPIIALTALAMPSDRERCIEAGMNDYFSKPINLRELVKTMQKHLPNPGTGKKP